MSAGVRMAGAGGGTAAADLAALTTGFSAPVSDGQRTFRALLDAMSGPGTLATVATEGLDAPPIASPALVAVLLTLADRQTRVWLSPRLAAHPTFPAFARFFTGCPLVDDASDAALVFCAAADASGLAPTTLGQGSDEVPEDGATAVIDVAGFATGYRLMLAGPGIASEAAVCIDGGSERLWADRIALNDAFPRGVDLVFTCADRLLAIPRSSRVERR